MAFLALPAKFKARHGHHFASGIILVRDTFGALTPFSIMLIVLTTASNASIMRFYAGALLPAVTFVALNRKTSFLTAPMTEKRNGTKPSKMRVSRTFGGAMSLRSQADTVIVAIALL